MRAQEEILRFLQKNKEWYTASEITDLLDMNRTTVSKHLRKLMMWDEVDAKYTPKRGTQYKMKRVN